MNKYAFKFLYILLAIFFCFIILHRFFSTLGAPDSRWLIEIFPERFPSRLSAVAFFMAIAFSVAILHFKKPFRKIALNKKKIIIALSALCVLRLVLFFIFYVEVEPKSDFLSYFTLAQKLTTGEIYIPKYIAVFPHVYGYPKFLSFFFNIFGSSVKLALGINLILSFISIGLIYQIGKSIKNERTGLFASALYVLLPSQFFYSYLLCAEYLFMATMLFCIFILFRSVQVKSKKAFIGLSVLNGILLALLTSIRPNGLILLIAIIITAVLFIDKFTAFNPKKSIVIICIAYIAAFFVTSYTNNLHIEDYISMKTVDNKLGWNLFVGLNQESIGTWNKPDSDTFSELIAKLSPDETQNELFRLAAVRLSDFESVGSFASFISNKTAMMWSIDHEVFKYIESGVSTENPWWMKNRIIFKSIQIYSDYSYFLLMGISIVYLLKKIKTDSRESFRLMVFILFFLGTVALHIPFEAAFRYHNVCLVPLCILAAAGLANASAKDLAKD